MLNQQTISILHSLKLFGMAESFERRLADTNQASLSHAEFVGLLVQDEKTHRDNLRLRRLLKKARLRQEAALEDINYGASRGLSRQVLLELSNSQWVGAHRNVLISGPTGIGKSFIACALGNAAARSGYTVLYMRAPRLFETLQQSRGDGYIESFNDKLRDECLNREIFRNGKEAQTIVEAWRGEYNNYRTPAEFATRYYKEKQVRELKQPVEKTGSLPL